jgi:hypothetical protein
VAYWFERVLANAVVVAAVLGVLGFLTSCNESEPVGQRITPTAPQKVHVPPAKIRPAPPCTSDECKPFLIAKLPTSRGTGIALDGAGFAYVSTFFDDAVYRVALQPNATPTLLYRSPGANLGEIEVHGDELRWSSNETGRIYAAPISGSGPIRVIADTLPGIWGFASDEEWIYWGDFGGSAPGAVWKKPLRGGPSVAIARHPASELVDHVLIQSTSELLFTDQSARMLRTSTSGGPAEIVLELEGDLRTSGVSQDATHLYISAFNDRIVRVEKATRDVEVFVTDPSSPAKVAVDATHVYWVDYTPVEIWGKRK